MSNLMIGFPNYIDESTIAGGSFYSTLPANNLKNRLLGVVARTSNTLAASTQFTISLTKPRPIGLVSLINHNISLDGKVRITAYSDPSFSTLIYDSGLQNVWGSVFDSLTLEWEDDGFWSGTYSLEDIGFYTSYYNKLMTSTIYSQYWKIEVVDTGNASGYVQIGRVFIGKTWQPTYNTEYGNITMGWETKTDVQESLSGSEFFQRRTPYRVVRFSLKVMNEDEAMVNGFEFEAKAGLDKEVFFIQNPEDTLHALRRQFMGRLRSLSALEYPYPNLLSKSFEIKEII